MAGRLHAAPHAAPRRRAPLVRPSKALRRRSGEVWHRARAIRRRASIFVCSLFLACATAQVAVRSVWSLAVWSLFGASSDGAAAAAAAAARTSHLVRVAAAKGAREPRGALGAAVPAARRGQDRKCQRGAASRAGGARRLCGGRRGMERCALRLLVRDGRGGGRGAARAARGRCENARAALGRFPAALCAGPGLLCGGKGAARGGRRARRKEQRGRHRGGRSKGAAAAR